jgi:hypothetical protein
VAAVDRDVLERESDDPVVDASAVASERVDVGVGGPFGQKRGELVPQGFGEP